MVNYEELGFTQEELQEKVVEKIVAKFLLTQMADGDGDVYFQNSPVHIAIEKRMQKSIDDAVDTIAEKYLEPNVLAYVEGVALQKTNSWGEKIGERVSFIEYLVGAAERYLTEQVDYDGKSKTQSSSYSWKTVGTRLAHMIDRHLYVSIENAMKKAIGDANSILTDGLTKTVKIQLEEIASKLKVKTEIR